LAGLSTGAVVIAGGQELMPSINYGQLMPSVYVDIGALKELKGVSKVDGHIAIGALTVHRELQTHPLIVEHLPLLAHAAAQVGGGWQVQNRGTIGGNIVSMHPLYDILPPLLALGAEVEVAAERATRTVALSALMTDTTHGLGSQAILTRILVKLAAGVGWGYEKLKGSAGSYASANAAALVDLKGGKIARLTVVAGAVSSLPIDVSAQLDESVGQAWSNTLAASVEAQVADAIQEPLSDQQGDGRWRRAMAGVMARRAVAAAVARAQTASKG
jgi:CO/xanthine dehydrogenase FAD-binding subunit